MKIILFDDKDIWSNLLPLTFTKPISELIVGHFTIAEKYIHHFHAEIFYQTQTYLQTKFPFHAADFFVNSSFIPTKELIDAIQNLNSNEILKYKDQVLAYKNPELLNNGVAKIFSSELIQIKNPWDIFTYNEYGIQQDFEYFIQNKNRIPICKTNYCKQENNIFIEEGAMVENCSLNPMDKKIIIAKGAELMEGTHVRGALSMGENAQTKLATKIYGATSIAHGSKVGGELNNVVMHSNSNKAHDGFLGNAVIGEWCNIGADSNNSNLKNNYASVKLWNYRDKKFLDTGLQFCGLIMGDHSKCGINTMFNTGTIVGICANIFGAGFPRNFLVDFSWGGAQGITTYRIDDVYDTIERVFARRNKTLSQIDKDIIQHVFNETMEFRK